MTENENPLSDRTERLNAAVAACLEALEGGGVTDPDALLGRYPEFRAELTGFFAGWDRLDQLAAPLREAVPTGQAVLAPAPPASGQLGDFRILREVGRGGMGVVYEAEQISLGRRVALKVLPFAAALDERQLRRFKHEAQAAGHLHHPHIVPVYAVGCERGVHYYAMQFIDGRPLSAVIHNPGEGEAPTRSERSAAGPGPHPLTVTEAGAALSTQHAAREPAFFRTVARLGVQAAEALQHAHEQGVLHRDVKPANLLLDGRGHLWVTDFGLAQFQKDAGLTAPGDVVGTLRYMSPERALGRRKHVDHRADIYGLGATLYELLTREPVFGGNDREELLRRIERDEPPPPRQLNPTVPADLETIILKALAKEPAERYATAQELADDLRRFLEDKPIRAKRPTPWQRFKKWARRHRGAVLAAGICGGLVLLLGVGGLAAGAVLLSREEERTKAVNRLLQLLLYYQTIASAEREHSTGNVGRAEQLLEQCDAALRGWEWQYLRRQRYGNPPPLRHGSHLWSLALRLDGGLLAVGGSDGTVTLWDPRAGKHVHTLKAHDGQVRGLAFSPDGRRLASASWDRKVKVWDVLTGAEVNSIPHSDGTLAVAFSPDGRRLAWGAHDGTARLRDLSTGREVALDGHRKGVRRLVFSPNGERLASCGDDGTVRIWDAAEDGPEVQAPRRTLHGHDHRVFDVAFSPDGQRLASAGGQFVMHGDAGVVKVWDADTGAELHTLHAHTGAVYAVAFSPDGRRLVSGGEDPTVKVWDTATGMEALTLRGHQEAVWAVAFSPDGLRVYSAGGDHDVRIWDATPLEQAAGPELHTLRAHAGRVTAVAFSPDGRLLVSAGMDRTVRVWDSARGVALDILPLQGGPVHCLAFSPDGRRLATGNWSSGEGELGTGAVRLWDTTTWAELPGPNQVRQPGVRGLAFSADGRLLAGAGDHVVMVWDARTGDPADTHRGSCHFVSVAFGRRGHLAAADENGGVTVWDAPPGQPSRMLPAYAGRAFCVAFSPDGRRLAAAGVGGAVKVWDTETWQPLPAPRGHLGGVRSVAFSPDGRLLASGGNDAVLRIWNAETGRVLFVLRGHTDTIHGLTFSPDGQRLVSGSKDGTAKVWDLAAVAEVGGWVEELPPDG